MNDYNIGYPAHGKGPLSPPEPDGVECKHCEVLCDPEWIRHGACDDCVEAYHCVECQHDEPLDEYGLCKRCRGLSYMYAVAFEYWGTLVEDSVLESELVFVDPSAAGHDMVHLFAPDDIQAVKTAAKLLGKRYHEFRITHIGELTPMEDFR